MQSSTAKCSFTASHEWGTAGRQGVYHPVFFRPFAYCPEEASSVALLIESKARSQAEIHRHLQQIQSRYQLNDEQITADQTVLAEHLSHTLPAIRTPLFFALAA